MTVGTMSRMPKPLTLRRKLVQERMLRRLNEVYANGAEPAERVLLKRIKAKVSRLIERF